ncbi:MAG: chlorite dismutase family protein [Pirellulaceae bacterium]
MDSRFYSFVGGDAGKWSVIAVQSVVGPSLKMTPRLEVQNANLLDPPTGAQWLLRGVTSNQRYVTRPEQSALAAVQPPLGRPEATCAALIPITKSPEWWTLTQDERREIFEARSSHIATGLRYLPAIARRLHHCRDLGEPFDFLTWFEFAPSEVATFDELVAALRATEEWNYVQREVEIRLIRNDQ